MKCVGYHMHKGRVPWVGLPLCISDCAQNRIWLDLGLSTVTGVLTHCVPMVATRIIIFV